MSVLRKKTEFYEQGSDREVIAIATGGLGEGAPLAGRFFHYGGPSLPFFPLPMKVLVPPIVT